MSSLINKIRDVGIGAMLFLSALTSCTDKKPEIRVGYMEHPSGMLYFIAESKGYFKKEGIDVELKEFSYKEHMDGLLLGQVDVITPTNLQTSFGIELQQKGYLRLFGFGGEEKDGEVIDGIVALKRAGINNTKDLEGKTLGVENTPQGYLNAQLFLKGARIKANIQQVEKTLLYSSLFAGRIDAVFVDQPNLIDPKVQDSLQLVAKNYRATFIDNPYWSGSSATTQLYAKKHQKELLDLMDALDEALDFSIKHPAEAKEITARYMPKNMPKEIAVKAGAYFRARSTEEVDLEAIQLLADKLSEFGILKSKIDAKGMYLSREELVKGVEKN